MSFWRSGGIYLLLALIFYFQHLLGLRRFPDGDLTYHFVPFALYLTENLAKGRLPLWNPYTFAGHPFLADVQAAVFYFPTTLLLLLTGFWNTPGARAYLFQVDAALHLALAGWGIHMLPLSLSRTFYAAFSAGITFAFSGFLTGYPPLQVSILHTVSWLPWALWGLHEGFSGHGKGWIASALALSFAFFAGHPQTFLMGVYLFGAWALFLAIQKPTWKSKLDALARTACLMLFVAGLTAVQWWPGLEFTRLSVRAHMSYNEAGGGFPFQDTWQLFFPGVLTYYSPLYVGIVPLALGMWAVLKGRRLRRVVLFWTGAALAFLLISYGQKTFLFPLLYRWAPGWSLFRGQERAASMVALSLSIIAGLGMATLDEGPHSRKSSQALIFPAAMAGAALIFALGWVKQGKVAVNLPAFTAIATRTLLWAGLGSLVMLWPGRKSRNLSLLFLILADLWMTNMSRNSVPGPAWNHTLTPPEVIAVKEALAQETAFAAREPVRVFNEYQVYADYGMVVKAEELGGSSPLRLARYAALFKDFPLHRLWRLFGVKYVLTWRKEMFMPAELLGTFSRGPDGGLIYFYRLEDSYPRAWVVNRIRVASDEEAWRWLADFASDVDHEAVVSPEAAHVAARLSSPGGEIRGNAQIRRLAPDHLIISGWSDREGLLIVSENWMPGWKAELRHADGSINSCIVVRANLTLIGIPVPTGAWEVSLKYRPDSVRYGLGLSLFSFLAGLFWVVCQRH